MPVHQKTLEIRSSGRGFVDLTPQVGRVVAESGVRHRALHDLRPAHFGQPRDPGKRRSGGAPRPRTLVRRDRSRVTALGARRRRSGRHAGSRPFGADPHVGGSADQRWPARARDLASDLPLGASREPARAARAGAHLRESAERITQAMRLFVTGATGFIGRHLCRKLASRGHGVVAMVRSSTKLDLLPRNARSLSELSWAAFADPGLVLPACDIVVHLAGIVAADKLEEYEAVNYRSGRGPAELPRPPALEAAAFAVRLVAGGSGAFAARPAVDRNRSRSHRSSPTARPRRAPRHLVQRASFPTTSFRPPIGVWPGGSGHS